jgi:hypothetical protein
MESQKLAAAEFSSNRGVSARCGHQGPMSQQNPDGFGSNQLHPQKLVRLVGCRDPHAQKHEEPIAVSSEEGH